MKYIPGEAIGFYLFLEGVIKTAVPTFPQNRIYLSIALLICLVFNWMYLRRIWKIRRRSQVLISSLALLVYVFASGGAFATFGWYTPWQGTALMGIAGAFLVFVEPPGPEKT